MKSVISLGGYEINSQTIFEFEEDDTFIDANFDSIEICVTNNNKCIVTYNIEVFTADYKKIKKKLTCF